MSEETVIAENKSSKKPSKNKRPKSKLQETIEFCIPIIIAVALAFILRTFVFANAVVPTGSMLNTIQEGDRIIASRMAYNNNAPERYDIILSILIMRNRFTLSVLSDCRAKPFKL